MLNIFTFNLTGAELAIAVQSEKDLVDLGLPTLSAKCLFRMISQWESGGLPVDFRVLLLPNCVPDEVVSSTPIAEARLKLSQAYNRARYCGDEASVQLIKTKSETGSLLACAYLGILYAVGCTGVAKNVTAAKTWIKKALPFVQDEANGGCMFAQHICGDLYVEGLGVTKDLKVAARHFKQAAAHGMSMGQYSLAALHEVGRGVKLDKPSAVKYYKLAADQGHAAAQYSAGRCYENGIGVTKEQRSALRYYKIVLAVVSSKTSRRL